ncbi:Zn-dependent protease with chaperone function PA4632 [Pseudoalteromonas luteoviolacea B = ATCC 29581]|nr:Zn-dependent protease with chaperone function PA4632 [Pseudoalteromonas luteoviolacea B = ATCC 29581]
MKNWLITACVAAVLVGCKTSPTGRTQIALYSEDQMAQMGSASFDELKKSTPQESNQKTNKYVQCVAFKIIEQLPQDLRKLEWEVVVFKDDSANAFALPGGKIGVHTGLLTVAKDQHQLAAVLGHEVAHVTARHANERISQGALVQTGLQLGNVALQMGDIKYRSEIMQALGLGTQVGIVLPFSRSHESEADIVGLQYMAKAGFEPSGAIALWQNMSEANGQRQPEFLSTHPAPENRIKQLRAHLTQVQPLSEEAKAKGISASCGS